MRVSICVDCVDSRLHGNDELELYHASWQISFGAENVLLSVILYNVGALVALFNG
jgi:hypothetical protein